MTPGKALLVVQSHAYLSWLWMAALPVLLVVYAIAAGFDDPTDLVITIVGLLLLHSLAALVSWIWSGRTTYVVNDESIRGYRGGRKIRSVACADVDDIWVEGAMSWLGLAVLWEWPRLHVYLKSDPEQKPIKFPPIMIWGDLAAEEMEAKIWLAAKPGQPRPRG